MHITRWLQINARIKTIVSLILLLVVSACANVVAPTGGQKDETPPQVLRSTPPNFSTNFEANTVRIFFDEYIELHNIQQNLLVSPPLEKQPEMRIRGKSILFNITDSLRANTTYNFFFGDAIRDITEGNPLSNFQYVVSTGTYVDSLMISGKVINGLTHEPEKEVFVMAYDKIYDSVPMLERPVYISKTNKEGEFTLNNMRNAEYLLFALLDQNFNYLFDMPEEKIAFLDSLITPAYPLIVTPALGPEKDPQIPQSENLPIILADTLTPDSLPIARIPLHTLYLFQQADTVQRISSVNLERQGKLNLVFRIPYDSISIQDVRQPLEAGWHIVEHSSKRDTLTLWMPNMERDTLFLEIRDRELILDTLKIATTPRQTPVSRGRQAQSQDDPKLTLKAANLLSGNTLPYFQALQIRAQSPIASIDTEKLFLWDSDTLKLLPQLELQGEANRLLQINHRFSPDSSYRLIIAPGALTDIFGLQNDSLIVPFKLNNEASYGSLFVNMELPDFETPFILQLLTARGEVVQEKIIRENGQYRFLHLTPSSYSMRLIADRNANGRWDTGHYLKKLQPEEVFIFNEPLQIRLNWELEMDWAPQRP